MKLSYHPHTDSLYIDLSEKASAESREISKGVVLDCDVEGNLVGIDIDNASRKVAFGRIVVSGGDRKTLTNAVPGIFQLASARYMPAPGSMNQALRARFMPGHPSPDGKRRINQNFLRRPASVQPTQAL